MTIPLLPKKHRKNTQLFFITFSSFAFVAMLWMFIFNIDIISNAEGQVIPAGDVKTIQHLEGGIIDQILVKESDAVKEGDSLVILAATASEVDVDEAQVQIDSKVIQSIRLEAEINNFDIPIFPDELVNKREELINKSIELFISRKDKIEGDIKEVNASIIQHQTAIDILIKQTDMSQQLLDEGIITEFTHLNLLKELNAAKGTLKQPLKKKIILPRNLSKMLVTKGK